MKLVRWLARFGLSLSGLIAGVIWSGCRVPLYGAVAAYGIVTPPHDPQVQLEDLHYSPAGPARPGESIEFSVTASKPTGAGFMTLTIGAAPGIFFQLNDEGYAPDALAGDGIWSGEWSVPEGTPAGSLPVSAQLNWWDGFQPLELAGPALEIEEEESQ